MSKDNRQSAGKGFQSPQENPDLFLQKRKLVARSPDGRFELLSGQKYRNLMIRDAKMDLAMLLQRDLPYSIGQTVTFVDNHTFCIDSGEYVDFYNARTGERVDFLEMQFGHKHGQKTLLGFTYNRESSHFAALFVHEEPSTHWGHHYHAALFDREGRLLDDFETKIELMQNWGKIVVPNLSLEENTLTVTSRALTADYSIVFYEHITHLYDKSL